MDSAARLRLGTRASALARWQAEWVSAKLAELGVDVELVPISTIGDRDQRGPVEQIGGQGVFTKEIQRALLDDRIDLAVHSLKDLPTDPVPGLVLAAVPERAPVSDTLVSRKHAGLDDLPGGAVLGTGSLRRRAQLLHVRPDLVMEDIRGNVDTRLSKLDRGDFDAIVLAEAGLRRLELAENITQVLPKEVVLPAVGQGALGIETRDNDPTARQWVEKLDHPATHAAVLAERAMLRKLHGGCMAPVAAWGRVEDGELRLTGRVLSVDGRENLEVSLSDKPDRATELGETAADALVQQGAAPLIEAART